MKQLIPMDDYGVFADMKNTARANSLMVAEIFEKRHFHVLRDIKNLDCSDQFRKSNFGFSEYVNDQGKRDKSCDMTRDGFMFLVMGYRGKKAAQFKEAYIRRFNEMESFIQNLLSTRKDYPELMEQVKLLHEQPKPYHFSNEADMLNRIVIGMTAKKYRKTNKLPKNEPLRPHLTPEQVELMNRLQKVDIGLLVAEPNYEARKRHLEWYAAKFLEKKAIA